MAQDAGHCEYVVPWPTPRGREAVGILMWTNNRAATRRSAACSAAVVVGLVPKWPSGQLGWLAGPLGEQPSRGEFQGVCVAAGAVISGHEVVADHEREGQRAAGFDLGLVAADRAE